MKIGGSYQVPLSQEQTYKLLQDPEILAQCMPGCDELKRIGPDEYEMKMKMAISAVQGLFTGTIRIADANPPQSFRLVVDGKGKAGFVKGDGVLQLAPQGEATDVNYTGDVQIGGMIASVGQRLVDGTSKFIIKKFFEKFVEVSAAKS